MSLAVAAALELELPDELAAHEPPEARGLARDGVRLMASRVRAGDVMHARFHQLDEFLDAGDVLVVNRSATINAAFSGARAVGGTNEYVLVHLSAALSDAWWVIELRRRTAAGNVPLRSAKASETILLPGGAKAALIVGFPAGSTADRGTRLWLAEVSLPEPTLAYARRYGSPIRYAYVPRPWPLRYYQTLFASEPGSAEMPSAARPFTPEVVRRLEGKGVRIAGIVLHTGVSSLEAVELPYPERYRVPAATAALVNRARAAGNRVVAVGTTAVRAIESATGADGVVRAAEGWTNLVITPERGLLAVDALLTGLHAPNASHLWLLEALAGRDHIAACYASAIEHGYLWHEFGDAHLILNGTA